MGKASGRCRHYADMSCQSLPVALACSWRSHGYHQPLAGSSSVLNTLPWPTHGIYHKTQLRGLKSSISHPPHAPASRPPFPLSWPRPHGQRFSKAKLAGWSLGAFVIPVLLAGMLSVQIPLTEAYPDPRRLVLLPHTLYPMVGFFIFATLSL